MLSRQEARELLYHGAVAPAPVKLEVVTDGSSSAPGTADFLLDLVWKGVRKSFVAVYKAVATPRNVETAFQEARALTTDYPGRHPLILVPYISPETATRLQDEEVSGLDFSGNVVIVIPGEWLVIRAGQPNRFPSNQPIKDIYEGRSALVGRVLLNHPRFDRVKEVQEEIVRRGGSIAMGTVSKVLTALEEDLILRKTGGITLLQPERLLDRLAANYSGPSIQRRIVGKASVDRPFLELLQQEATRAGVRLAGRSESLYVIAPTAGEHTRIYVSRMGDWLNALPFSETDRFANIEFAETRDEAVFFDMHIHDDFPWCSKLQIYLELMQGSKRERDTAAQIRGDFLRAQ